MGYWQEQLERSWKLFAICDWCKLSYKRSYPLGSMEVSVCPNCKGQRHATI